jgi:quercetin dioxygenase-like cupin family protein
MNGKFISSAEVEREQLDWGELGWISRPSMTGGTKVVVIEVTLKPGKGHNFHKHPTQEEVITVIEGEIEQWLEAEKQILGQGDSIFIDANVVHASFNVSSRPAKLMVVLGPCAGDGGYVVDEVADQLPWSGLR